MIKNKHIAILVTLMFALTMFSPVAYALNFSDISGHWAEDQIKSMTDEGIINGYPEGTFQPDGKITRAEFASLLVTAFGLTKGEGKSFTDTVDHWAKEAIAAANAAGIVNGYSDTIFGPDDPITREQMAVMIVKAARLTDAANAKTFADSSFISDWAKEAVDIATSNQLISGYPDNTFQPQGNATRAEATAVLSGVLKKSTPPAKPAEKVEEEQEDTVIEKPVESTNRGGGSSSSSSSSKTKISAVSITATVTGNPYVGATLPNEEGVTVKLETATTGAEIYYTLDGSNPTTSSKKYENEITVNNTALDVPENGGTVLLKAIAIKNGYRDSDVVTLEIKFEAAEVSISAISISGEGGATTITTKDGTLQMIATISPSNASNKAVTWSVNDASIATIDDNGKLTAKADGTVVVTATAKDKSGVTGTFDVTVSDTTVADAGKLTIESVKPGSVAGTTIINIIEKIPSGYKRVYKIGPSEVTGLKVTDKVTDGKDYHEFNITINANQYITIYEINGETKEVAKYVSRQIVDSEIKETVTIPVESILLPNCNIYLAVGEEFHLTVTFTPYKPTNQNVTWLSDDSSVATVNEYGTVTAVGIGKATITATSEDGGYESTSDVTVGTKITEAHFTGFTLPVKDAVVNFEFDPLPEGVNYTADNVRWSYIEEGKENSTDLEDGDTFQAGKEYELSITIYPEEGYILAHHEEFTATINGEYANKWLYYDASMRIYKEYTVEP